MISLSIVIPAYNEEKRLPSTLNRVGAFCGARTWSWIEVIVVDDGSTDRTADVVAGADPTGALFRVLRNSSNRGKGYSVRAGMRAARGEWVLFSDADLSTPIEDIERLEDAARRQQAAIAFGSRALDRSLVSIHQPWLREMSGRLFNHVMRLVTGLPFRDTQCGFKLYRSDAAREIFARQRLDGFGFDVEDLYLASKLGFRAVEVPVRWADVAGTKVSMVRGLEAFVDLIRVRINDWRNLYL